MNEDVHQRAQRLIAASRVEGVSASEREWLEGHLQTCPQCAEDASSFERLVGALRLVPVSIDSKLLRATQLRVRLRARELREHHARIRALWISCALSWILGAVSAPFLWRGFQWIGERFALPGTVWLVAFALWWVLPAAAVAAVLTWQRSRATVENDYAATKPR